MQVRKADRRTYLLVAVLVSLFGTASVRADEEPLLEIGVGAGAIAFEDYRGSGTTHAYPVPVPYLLYHGKLLRSDRDGVRGTLFDQDWVELNMSGDLTTPVRKNRERSGMPDLNSTLALGPSLDFHLLHSSDSNFKLDLRLPLHAAFTVQAAPKYIGWTVTPRLALDLTDPLGFTGWHAGFLAGPLFADRRYHGYFYTVAEQYATASRPAYQAVGGYAGTQAIAALSKRFPRFWIGAYARADSLSRAAFADSPLVERNSYWSAGIGFAWIVHTSAQMVEVSP